MQQIVMNNNLAAIVEKTLEEHSNFQVVFNNLKEIIFQKKSLVTRMARHPLFEIEPFENLLRNEYITSEERALLFVTDVKEVNTPYEKCYTFTIDSETNQIVHRSLYDENNNCFETIFWYEENYHKSMERYVHHTFPHHHGNICYTFFKNGLPDFYLSCKYAQIKLKEYHTANGRVIGYQQKDTQFSYTCDVTFDYDTEGNIDLIKEFGKDRDVPRELPEILFKRPYANQTLEETFKKIEDFLVTRICEQIQQHVRIDEEVYCLMLKYAMPEAFPPELAIGVVPDLPGPFETLQLHELYNTPDLRYYSDENTLPVNLYEEKMQYLYLQYYRAYDFFKYNKETFEYWDEIIKQVYLGVCKRLMEEDFSKAFRISKDYLVVAREANSYDVKYFYERMKEYKK